MIRESFPKIRESFTKIRESLPKSSIAKELDILSLSLRIKTTMKSEAVIV